MESVSNAFHRIMAGQSLLVICSIIYIVWWSISFRPGQQVNRIGGFRGILLLLTAVSGIAGVYLSVSGLNSLPAVGEKLNGLGICLAGIILYFAAMVVTMRFFSRPVTTELILITGFLVLELCMVNGLNASGNLSDTCFTVMLVANIATYIIGMILYVLYYRVEAWRAFYLAMVPLIVDGISALLLVLLAML